MARREILEVRESPRPQAGRRRPFARDKSDTLKILRARHLRSATGHDSAERGEKRERQVDVGEAILPCGNLRLRGAALFEVSQSGGVREVFW